ncbi:hypothetical protein [Pseudodonghicola flavimaris]|uniref:Lipoprotein n=1 Tax=Pseudodonghicola flavimaris TaxID=3050036 RepID=A0ABT7F6L6_9RHOB|nr:hypothetical protein [Pseudodonghicola flavimaris]MDK3020257.1 hypothetical protein [Pseudodonghicola flavimaris]
MRYLMAILGLAMLAACNTPSLPYRGKPATRIAVNGSVFDVRLGEKTAEAIRINREFAPRFEPVRTRAALAMMLVSGCKVTKVRGDQAVVVAKLSCAGKPPGVVMSCHRLAAATVATAAAPPAYRCDPKGPV